MTNCEYKYRQKIPSVNLNILVVTLTSKGILVTLICFARYTPLHSTSTSAYELQTTTIFTLMNIHPLGEN
jgi:hypothetical protein